MSNKLRWGKFYWSDWADDPALALCSLAAQGLWMRLLCIAAQGTPYGHVTINGKIPDTKTLAKIARIRPDYCARLIVELERNGVASRSVQGALTSRRQVRDAYVSMARSSAAKARWIKEKSPDSAVQKDPFASCSTESLDTQDAQELDFPPKPPASGGLKKTQANIQHQPTYVLTGQNAAAEAIRKWRLNNPATPDSGCSNSRSSQDTTLPKKRLN